MPHFVEQKKHLKTDILLALDRAGKLDYEKTVAEFCLDTGFAQKTVKKVLEQMHVLDYISINDGVITRPGVLDEIRRTNR